MNISWEARACGGKVAQPAALSQVAAVLGQNPTTGALALGTESLVKLAVHALIVYWGVCLLLWIPRIIRQSKG